MPKQRRPCSVPGMESRRNRDPQGTLNAPPGPTARCVPPGTAYGAELGPAAAPSWWFGWSASAPLPCPALRQPNSSFTSAGSHPAPSQTRHFSVPPLLGSFFPLKFPSTPFPVLFPPRCPVPPGQERGLGSPRGGCGDILGGTQRSPQLQPPRLCLVPGRARGPRGGP